jgi:hypothetical protein
VDAGHGLDLVGEAADVLVAAVGPRPGDDGPREQDGEAERDGAAAERDDPGRDGGHARCVGLTGPVVQHDRIPDQQRGQQEVTHHDLRRELREHGDAAQHALPDQPGDQAPGPPDQVAAPGRARRPEHGQADGDRDRSREQAVQLLDGLVEPGDVDELALAAGRPVRASEARPQ